MTPFELIEQYYPAGTPLRDTYMRHVCHVASKALEIAARQHLAVDKDLVEEAALLHDIGIVFTDAPGIGCNGTEPYIRHGILGAKLLRDNGFADEVARVAERHTGAGITPADITELSLPLPPGDYMPRTLLERLICYADKFFSKTRPDQEKTIEQVRASMAKHSPGTLERFEALHREFKSRFNNIC